MRWDHTIDLDVKVNTHEVADCGVRVRGGVYIQSPSHRHAHRTPERAREGPRPIPLPVPSLDRLRPGVYDNYKKSRHWQPNMYRSTVQYTYVPRLDLRYAVSRGMIYCRRWCIVLS